MIVFDQMLIDRPTMSLKRTIVLPYARQVGNKKTCTQHNMTL
jgi:hypothetical protein